MVATLEVEAPAAQDQRIGIGVSVANCGPDSIHISDIERDMMFYVPQVWEKAGPIQPADYTNPCVNHLYQVLRNPEGFACGMERMRDKWVMNHQSVYNDETRARMWSVFCMANVLAPGLLKEIKKNGMEPRDLYRCNNPTMMTLDDCFKTTVTPEAQNTVLHALWATIADYKEVWSGQLEREFHRIYRASPEVHDPNTYREIQRVAEEYAKWHKDAHDERHTHAERHAQAIVDWRCAQIDIFSRYAELVTGTMLRPKIGPYMITEPEYQLIKAKFGRPVSEPTEISQATIFKEAA